MSARLPGERRLHPPSSPARPARSPSTQPALEPLRSSRRRQLRHGSHCLGVLLRRPDLLYRVDRDLQKFGLQRLSPDDFQHADHQAILRLLQESVDQDVAEPLNYVLNRLSLPMMEVADDLLARTAEARPERRAGPGRSAARPAGHAQEQPCARAWNICALPWKMPSSRAT